MKGIILAGGTGSRLAPLTNVINKHLLPVYDRPMILYPLETIKRAGLTDVLIITGSEHIGRFIEFLGDGSRFKMNLSYRVQEKAGGIAEALSLCEDFSAGDDVAVLLGDNIFSKTFIPKKSKYGCTLFLKKTDEEGARRFGCALVSGGKVIDVEEKPPKPKSLLSITGYYIFPQSAFKVIKKLKPSKRGELEITDVVRYFVEHGDCGFSLVKDSWFDAGTFDSLLEAGNHVRKNYAC